MFRTFQVLRSAARVGVVRLTNKYDWKFEMAQQCQELGGVYVKFLQMLAVHHSTKYIVEGMGTDLAFEQVPYEPLNLPKELGSSQDKLSYIQPEPFAAGSYGQVYRATLKSGQDVIVKVLRPSVRRTLKTDLRILEFIGRITSWFAGASIINFHMMAREFARATWAETNYRLEAENGERIRAYYDKYGTLVIPRSYTELTTRTVLVQEYIGGVSIASLEAKQLEGYRIDDLVRRALGSDVWVQLRTMGTEMLRATLYADYLMIDPHPGNVRLLPENKVALIDFGLTGRAPSNRMEFAELIHEFRKLFEDRFEAGSFAVAMLSFMDVELHDALEIVAKEHNDDYAFSLQTFVENFVQAQAGQTKIQHYLSDKQLLQLFMDVLNRENKLGIRISEENALLQRSMTMFLSVIRAISDAHDGSIYTPLVRDCLVVVDDEAIRNGVAQSKQRHEMSEERAFEVASNWLAVVAERDRKLYKFITGRSYAT